LTDDVMRMIIRLKLGKIARRIAEHYKASFDYSPELVDAVASRCTEVDTGARNVDHILSKTLLPELSAEFLSRMASGSAISKVEVGLNPDGTFAYAIN